MPSEPNYSAAAGYSPKAEAQYGGDTLRGSPGFGSSSPMDRIQIARSGEMEREIGQLALQLERAHTLLSKLRERLYPILVDTPPDAVTGGVEKEQSPQTPARSASCATRPATAPTSLHPSTSGWPSRAQSPTGSLAGPVGRSDGPLPG